MSKKNYEKPTMEFVEYEQEEQLLAGSVESTRFDNGDAYEKHLGIRDYPSPRVMLKVVIYSGGHQKQLPMTTGLVLILLRARATCNTIVNKTLTNIPLSKLR